MRTGIQRLAILLGCVSVLPIQQPRGQCSLTWQRGQVSGRVAAVAAWDPDGPGPATSMFVFGGLIKSIPGFSSPTFGVATYDPAAGAWTALHGLSNDVRAFTTDAANQLVAGGGGPTIASGSVDRWDGVAWTNLGSFNGYVLSLVTLPNGDIVAGGDFTMASSGGRHDRIARYDGQSWNSMSTGMDSSVRDLKVSRTGELFAVGSFTTAGGVTAGGIAKWTGGVWMSLPTGNRVTPWSIDSFAFRPPSYIDPFALLPNDNIVAGGTFFDWGTGMVEYVAEWDGSGWTPLGHATLGQVNTVAVLPGGDVLAGGWGYHIVDRWDGNVWSPQVSGLRTGPYDTVFDFGVLSRGDLMAAGQFGSSIAYAPPPCTASFGTGCTGSGGVNTLTADATPSTGSLARAHVTGILPVSLALVLWGTGQLSVPLSTISPVGAANCSLLVTPDVLIPRYAPGTTLQTSIPIPNNPALTGMALHHQVALVEIGAGGAFTKLTSTNGITFTIPAF